MIFTLIKLSPKLSQHVFNFTLTAYSSPVALWMHFLHTEYEPLPISCPGKIWWTLENDSDSWQQESCGYLIIQNEKLGFVTPTTVKCITCLISYSSRMEVVLIWNLDALGWWRKEKKKTKINLSHLLHQ